MEYSSFIKAGGNLAIESVQDKDSYTSHNESKGMGLSIGSMKKSIDNNKMKSSLMLVCQTYVTPCLMKSWSVSFGDFHPSGRIGKQL